MEVCDISYRLHMYVHLFIYVCVLLQIFHVLLSKKKHSLVAKSVLS